MWQSNTSPSIRAQQVVQKGIVVNIVLSLIKFAGGFWGNSFALIADAIESWVDFASSFAVWIGLKTASIPPDKNHPYGHGKIEFISAAIEGVLICLAGVIILIEAVQNLFHQNEIHERIRNDEDYDDWEYGTEPLYESKNPNK